MLIRAAKLQDADMLARAHVDTWRQAYAGIVPADFLAGLTYERSAERWRGRLSNVEPGQFVFVAENGASQVVGFATGGPERDQDPEYQGEVYALYVRPEYQRHHLGRKLVQTSVEHLRQNGIGTLLIWVLAQNPSRRFYESLGGQPARERTVEIGGAALPEVGYGWRDLSAFETSLQDTDEHGKTRTA